MEEFLVNIMHNHFIIKQGNSKYFYRKLLKEWETSFYILLMQN